MNTPDRMQQEEVFRRLIEAVVDHAICLLDPDGRVFSWNRGAEQMMGYAADDIVGRSFAVFFTEEDQRLNVPSDTLDAARRSGRFETEGWRVRKDGSRFWALAAIDVIRDKDGQVIGFAKVTRVVTDRHLAQEALLESERQFRLLVQGVTDYAIFMLDADGNVVNWNAGARRIKGYEDAEIIGSHFSRFYTESEQAEGMPARALEEAAQVGRFEAEGWRVRRDGSRFWANVVIDAIRNDAGELIGFAKVTRDLTERQRSQNTLDATRAQLSQSQKLEALGQLTGGVAHDFNNVLQVITSGLSLAEKLLPADSRVHQLHREMRNATDKATRLTGQLLAFSRQAPVRLERVDTALAIAEAVALFSRSLAGEVEIEVLIEPGLWPVKVDTALLATALLNLAMNARDAMPDGGTLRISASNVVLTGAAYQRQGPFVAISVADTGSGIPDEVLERVFEPFFTTKAPGKGTGLGLSLVHGFAEQAGGNATIKSRVGEGTEITLFLPRAEPDGAGTEMPHGEEISGPGALRSGLRVLVVDDDPAVSRLTVRMLEGAGHVAVPSSDAGSALALLSEGQKYDFLLSDIVMYAGMNGVELAREVRKRQPDLPILLATGYAGNATFFRQEFPVLYKPFTAIELAHAMALVLRT